MFYFAMIYAESQRSSTTPCWPRLVFITIPVTISSWALLVENTLGCAHWQLPIQVIPISLDPRLLINQRNKCFT